MSLKIISFISLILLTQIAQASDSSRPVSVVGLASVAFRIVEVLPMSDTEIALVQNSSGVVIDGSTEETLLDRLCISECWQQEWVKLDIENPTDNPRKVIVSSQSPYREITAFASLDRPQTAIQRGVGGTNNLFSPIALTIDPGVQRFYFRLKSDFAWTKPAFVVLDPVVFDGIVHQYFIFVIVCFGMLVVLCLLNSMSTIALRTVSFVVPLQVIVSYLAIELMLVSGTELLPKAIGPIFAQVWYVWVIWVAVLLVRLQLRYLPDIKSHAPSYVLVYYRVASVVAVFAILACVLWPLQGSLALIVLLGINFSTQILFSYILRAQRTASQSAYIASIAIIASVSVLMFITMRYGAFLAFDISKLRLILGIAFVVIYSIQFNHRISRIRLANETLRANLKGIIADTHIDRLLREGKDFDGRPRLQRATIMFVEVVGFAETTGRLSAEQSFLALRKNLADIRAAVLRYDGFIDKSLADGIICFFSHGYLGIGGADHERRALMAARDIQRANVAKILSKPQEFGSTTFPFRIGINTADIYIGNMGTRQRLDISLSGEGVVMAKRFEAACEPYKVLIGKSTFDALGNNFQGQRNFQRRFVPVKHFQEVKEAFEYNAFIDRPQSLSQVRASLLRVHRNDQKAERYDCDPTALVFKTAYGAMNVVDFSSGGFCLLSPIYLGNGVTFDMEFEERFLMHDDALSLLNPLRVEVSWGMHTELEEFKIGVKLLGLNASQKEYLLDHLKRHLRPDQQNLAQTS